MISTEQTIGRTIEKAPEASSRLDDEALDQVFPEPFATRDGPRQVLPDPIPGRELQFQVEIQPAIVSGLATDIMSNGRANVAKR